MGLIRDTFWTNTMREGALFNVTVERNYKDGEEWKSTNSFGRDDLLKLAKLADSAHSGSLGSLRQAAYTARTDSCQPVSSGLI